MIINSLNSTNISSISSHTENTSRELRGRELEKKAANALSTGETTQLSGRAIGPSTTETYRPVDPPSALNTHAIRKERPFTLDEVQYAEVVGSDTKGVHASRVFSQIKNFSSEPALVDTFA